MICSANHSPEIMQRYLDRQGKGFIHVCPRCGNEQLQTVQPMKFDLSDWNWGQCYMCLNMDTSEAQDLDGWGHIPGRCQSKGYRILDREIPTEPCVSFRYRHNVNWMEAMMK